MGDEQHAAMPPSGEEGVSQKIGEGGEGETSFALFDFYRNGSRFAGLTEIYVTLAAA